MVAIKYPVMMTNSNYIYGLHSVLSALQSSASDVNRLYVQESRHDSRLQDVINLAKQKRIAVEIVARSKLDELMPGAKHQGVIAVLSGGARTYSEVDLPELLDGLQESAFLLVLDGVQDPHNLGACLRSANAAGVHVVIAPRDNAASLTPVARKVASGAAELTPFVQVTNLARTLRMLKERGIWVYGADAEAGLSLYETDLTGNLALVMGAEGSGLRRLTRECCDGLLRIPMAGAVASLNVSVATGICLFEALRQRG
jgi:23S rRNA (guanosine2251-2'-O)-methyltransferase